jgi:hypothetical protein
MSTRPKSERLPVSVKTLSTPKAELSELSERPLLVRKPFIPRSFIGPTAMGALKGLPIRAWDVMPAANFLKALGVADKMLANRWLYRQVEDAPPFETVGRWRSGPGSPRVIRKDMALAWLKAPGKVSGSECWPYAADDLALLGWPGLQSPEAVQEILSFLLGTGIIQPAIMPTQRTTLDQLYI